jgi:ABC-type transport system involved in cytochrome c biogenesis permease component
VGHAAELGWFGLALHIQSNDVLPIFCSFPLSKPLLISTVSSVQAKKKSEMELISAHFGTFNSKKAKK